MGLCGLGTRIVRAGSRGGKLREPVSPSHRCCTVICGAEGWEDIEAYGHAQAEWFREMLDLSNGMPGHDTFRRVLSRLDMWT